MMTHDLGIYTAELREDGTLSIFGEGKRVDLPVNEALDLFHWLHAHREQLMRMVHEYPLAAEPANLGSIAKDEDAEYPEPEIAVDEP